MSNRSHLSEIARRAALVAAQAIPVFGQKSVPAQSLPLGPAVPAAPTKYDFQWEKYTANLAPGGKAFHVFEGPQPVGIAAIAADGKAEIFPIVSGAAAEELKASFERYTQAKGVGATFLSRTRATSSIALSRLPDTGPSGTPTVIFDAKGSHVSLTGGTSVDFLVARMDVTMPAAIPSLPATRISFSSKGQGGAVGEAIGEMGITLNRNPINLQRTGPVWEGLKALVLRLALSRAARAAQIVGNAPRRPAGSPDYVALVAEFEKRLN